MEMAEEVAPRTGAWIETRTNNARWPRIWSLPVRERGLKLLGMAPIRTRAHVAPRTGAWIETCNGESEWIFHGVAPRTGAWIETASGGQHPRGYRSLPVRERGLKLLPAANIHGDIGRSPYG